MGIDRAENAHLFIDALFEVEFFLHLLWITAHLVFFPGSQAVGCKESGFVKGFGHIQGYNAGIHIVAVEKIVIQVVVFDELNHIVRQFGQYIIYEFLGYEFPWSCWNANYTNVGVVWHRIYLFALLVEPAGVDIYLVTLAGKGFG